MKILYRQKAESALESLGIQNTFVKEIAFKNDYNKTTRKFHAHKEYEIHMVFRGEQCYAIGDGEYKVREKQIILIPPNLKHRMLYASENLLKYSVTFHTDHFCTDVQYGLFPQEMEAGILFIAREFGSKLPYASLLIENRVAEVLVLLSRMVGKGLGNAENTECVADNRLELADKFISDNIEQKLVVSDVAAYCHLSARQLNRIFMETKGVSPAEYILAEKMKRVGECVKNTDLTLRQISELFSFNNEYYFNTSFKKHFGMPPMAYRKMFQL